MNDKLERDLRRAINVGGLLGNDTELLNRCYDALFVPSQQSAPAGYAMVPVEPTPEMVKNAHCIIAAEGIRLSEWMLNTTYRAMLLAAAPKAECTNSDSWNCKYCNKTKDCEALKDSRNFAAPQPVSDDVTKVLAKALAKALELAANRLASLAIRLPYPSEERYTATEWGEEAREALAAYRAAMGSKGE